MSVMQDNSYKKDNTFVMQKCGRQEYYNVVEWIRNNMSLYRYENSFDMAIDCACDLGICRYSEVTGDMTSVPDYVVVIAEMFIPKPLPTGACNESG